MLSPTQGPVGSTVVITGTGFGSSQGSSTVKFNGTAVTASAWSTTSLTVTVPTGATSGGVIVTVSNVPSDDAPFTVTGSAPSTSDIYYYFSDALGTARVITTSDGTVCYDADLYPYGGVRTYNSTCGPSQVFTTYERDPESNNDYAMARYFSSRLGRFMSPDPSGINLSDLNDPQQLNLYSYVRNNPLRFTDPYGLYCVNSGGDVITDADGNPVYTNQTDCEDPNQSNGYWITVDGQDSFNQQITVNGNDNSCSMSSTMCQMQYQQLKSCFGGDALCGGPGQTPLAADIEKSVAQASASGNFWGRVVVNGQQIIYRAYTLPNGAINVGTYTVGAP